MIMIVKTSRSQVGSLAAAAEGGGNVRGGGRGKIGERSGMRSKVTLESTAQKSRS